MTDKQTKITEIAALNLSIELGMFLTRNFPIQKEHFPGYTQLSSLYYNCSLCDYYIMLHDLGMDYERKRCKYCCLNNCGEEGSDYEKWFLYLAKGNGTKTEAKKSIMNITRKLRARKKELTGDKKNRIEHSVPWPGGN